MTRPDLRADLRQRTQVSVELHHAIGTIISHWEAIQDMANGRGWASRQGGGSIGGHSDPTGNAAQHPDDYGQWITDLAAIRTQIRQVADRATILDPPPATNIGRLNGVDICAKCLNPIGDKAHRIDGTPVCANTCYHQLYRQARAEHTTVGTLVKHLADRLRANGNKSPGQST